MILLDHSIVVRRKNILLYSFKKFTMRCDLWYENDEGEEEEKEKRVGCLSSSSRSWSRKDETGGERLKTERSGTSWSGGDDSISFSSSFLPAEVFREGIERMTGDSRGKRKSVSNVTCGLAMLLIALSVVNYLPSLLWEPYLCCPFSLGLLFSPFAYAA